MTKFLTKSCDGCGGKIEATTPQTHVYSRHTGLTYCAKCATGDLPPKHKRPEATRHLTIRHSTREVEGRSTVMATTKTEGQNLMEGFLQGVSKISGATVVEKKSYQRVIAGGKTVANAGGGARLLWLNITFPEKLDTQKFKTSDEVAKAVSAVEGAATAAVAAAAAAAPAKPAKAAPAGSTKQAKPDPKPQGKAKAKAAA